MTWQDVRNVLVYPALIAGGIAWALLFLARYRGCAATEAAWSAALGLACAMMGVFALAALAVARNIGPGSSSSSFVFFLAVASPAVVILAGAIRLFWLTWRDGHGGDSG